MRELQAEHDILQYLAQNGVTNVTTVSQPVVQLTIRRAALVTRHVEGAKLSTLIDQGDANKYPLQLRVTLMKNLLVILRQVWTLCLGGFVDILF